MSTNRFSLGRVTTVIEGHLDDDWLWLALATGVGGALVGLYYVTHPYPAYGGGLYLEIAEELLANGYRLPRTIPHYTAGGIPFAYPPLLFYVYAALLDLGVDLLSLTRILPGLVTITAFIPYYYLSRELLDSPRQAGVATIAYGSIPVATQWHITAGGLVRAPALLFALAGLYSSVKLFTTGRRRWLALSTVLFGVTLLTHPQYATLFGVSTLLVYLFFDRSVSGLVHGVCIAGGGIVLAAPWWLRVVLVYGITPLTSAASTHGGLLNEPTTLIEYLIVPIGTWPTMAAAHLGLLIGGIYYVYQRRFFIPVWLLVVTQYTAAPRYLFIPGAMLFAVCITDVWRLCSSRLPERGRFSQNTMAVLLGIVVLTTAVGSGAVGGVASAPASYASYISEDDVDAMQWVHTKTKPDAEFVVVGDVADWFPYVAERTSLVSPWGAEWVAGQYSHHIEMTKTLVACHTAGCLTEALARYDLSPQYLYIPNGRVTARGFDYHQPPSMRRSLVASDRYQIVYENPDVMIVGIKNETQIHT